MFGSGFQRSAALGLALGLTLGLGACGPYASASDPAPPGEGPAPAESGAPPADGSGTPSTPETGPEAAPPVNPKLEVILTGRPIQAFAIGGTHVFTLESDVQTRLVATDKAKPHAVKVLLQEDIVDGVRFASVGAARGRAFVVDSYGAMRSMKSDGTDVQNEYPPGSATRILSGSNTLWLAELPQFLGDDLLFRWFGAPPSQVSPSSAQLLPTGTVGDLAVDDEALVYATRGSATTLRHWAPAVAGPRQGHRLLATLPEEGHGIGIDATRAYAYLAVAREIRAYDRTTGASTTVLAGAAFDTLPQLRSDGQSLYVLTETALRRCSIASCSSTMSVMAEGLQFARGLVVDEAFAWIVMTTAGKTGVIARVPK